uniref:Uncharacterized protein n=1 Tax=Candidatus Kentrum sp. FW TaxID=2126338 RepID=A0A450U0V8_9GAMM|nr:MAG: hypothetical protein BECKFW1821C_GA0114237_10924 [Candidatus Kentron sp. FW]
MTDEIMHELWQVKDAIAAKYDYDVRQLVKHLRTAEKSSGARVVDLRARQIRDNRTEVSTECAKGVFVDTRY